MSIFSFLNCLRLTVLAVFSMLSCLLTAQAQQTFFLSQADTPINLENRPVVTMTVLDTMVNPFDAFLFRETFQSLRNALPEYDIRTVVLSEVEAIEQIQHIHPDFIFAPSAFTALNGLDAVRVATRKTHLAQNAEQSVGAAIIVRSNSRAQTLSDLRGSNIFSGLPSALDGWLAVQAEIYRTQSSPESFFKSVSFRNNAYPDVVSALLSGAADAAILPACLLESVLSRKLIEPSSVRVINDQSDPLNGLACMHSTALYPDINLLALPSAPEDIVRDVTIAILSLKNTAGCEWLTNVSHSNVNALLRELKIGPYAYLKDMSLGALYKRHQTEVKLAIALILLLLFNEIRLHILLKRRTRELTSVMTEREKISQEAARTRLQLAGFERRSIVQQMSSMIAHEINAPVGGIRTWAAIARLKTPFSVFKDGEHQIKNELDNALKHIDHEADRIAEIVSRVRGYARHETQSFVVCDLTVILDNAVRAFGAEENPNERTETKLTMQATKALVMGQPLELEILFLNLIRNASAALKKSLQKAALQEPAVVTISLSGSPDSTCSSWCVTVENPGQKLSDEDYERLTQLSASISSTPSSYSGLGLGLTICRGIADRHGASLTFERRNDGGVIACVCIDAEKIGTQGTNP